jgi:hypothetical protein
MSEPPTVGSAARQIPWLRIFVEGVTIVASILLAFAIDAWWDGRLQRAAERAAIVGLVQDFEANTELLDDALRATSASMDRIWRVSTLTDAEIAATPVDSAQVYLFSLWVPTTFDSRDATLDALIASGNLDLIRDAQLRGILARWKNLVTDATEESELIFDVSGDVLRRVGFLGGPWQQPLTSLPHPEPDLARAARDEELMGLARAKRDAHGMYQFALRQLASLADSTLTVLKEQEGAAR